MDALYFFSYLITATGMPSPGLTKSESEYPCLVPDPKKFQFLLYCN